MTAKLETKQDFEKLVGNGYFSVLFTKRDGTERRLNGRLGVFKYVKGTDKRKTLPDDLIIVYDQKKRAYRSFHLNSVKEVKAGGTVWRRQQP